MIKKIKQALRHHIGRVFRELVRFSPLSYTQPDTYFYHSFIRVNLHAEEIMAHLKKNLPLQSVVGFSKIRLGNPLSDGGYVVLDDFEGLQGMLSLGVGGDVSFDIHVAEKIKQKIVLVDKTVSQLPDNHSLFEYEKYLVGYEDASMCIPSYISIEALLKKHFPVSGASKSDLILKADIEGSEWPMFLTMRNADLERFKHIVCEFHFNFNYTIELIKKVFERISQTHALVHAHANAPSSTKNFVFNHSFMTHTTQGPMPMFMELTFVRKEDYELHKSDEILPTSIDVAGHGGEENFWGRL